MFTQEDIIHSYGRQQAMEDGQLIELDPKLAKEAGILLPIACTPSIWAIVNPTERLKKQGQSVTGRLWDLFSMFCWAARRNKDTNEILFRCLFLEEGKRKPSLVTMKATIDGGDNGEPVITLMLPEED